MLPPPPNKYRINLLIEERSAVTGLPKVSVIKELADRLSITTNALWRYRASKTGEGPSLNSEQLQVIAEYFECSIDEIINSGNHVKSVS